MNKDNNNVYDVTPYFLYDSIDSFSETIAGQEYFFKHSFNILYELLADEIFRELNLPCVRHEICKIGNKYLLFSKSFKKDNCNYYTGKDLVAILSENNSFADLKRLGIDNSNLNNLNTIWNMLALKDYDKEDIRKVLIEFIKQYTMSILLLDPDFHSSNWTIEENGKHISLMPKYDNESAFQSDIFGMEFSVDEYDNTGSSIDSLKNFLAVSADEDKLIAYNLILNCDEQLVINAFNKVVNKYHNIFNVDQNKTLANILAIFTKQRNGIMNMIKEMEIKYGR